jgi:uncharacterized GH25 family protein
MVSVKVVYRSTGKPVSGAKVSIGFNGIMRGFSKTQYTDNSGETHFDNDPGTGTIYINGNSVFEGRVEGMKVIYI